MQHVVAFELRDAVLVEAVDDLQLTDLRPEGGVLLLKIVVGLGRLQVLVTDRSRRRRMPEM